MSRNLKALGLALMGLLALTAVAASSASAAEVHSGATSGTTYITATSENVNQLDLANGSNVKCGHTVYEGKYTGTTAADLTLKPTYTECQSSGQTTTINTGTCEVTLTAATQTTSTDNYDGLADLNCSGGGKIVVSVGDPTVTCTVTVSPQTLGGTVDYTDVTSAEKNLDNVTVLSTLKVAYAASGSVCGTANTGSLTGALVGKAYNNATHTEQVDLWID